MNGHCAVRYRSKSGQNKVNSSKVSLFWESGRYSSSTYKKDWGAVKGKSKLFGSIGTIYFLTSPILIAKASFR